MKTLMLCILCTFAANVVCGQIFWNHILEEVNVSPPQFKGTENDIANDRSNIANFYQYMSTQIVYPQLAVDKQQEGTEVVQFIVNENGEVGDFKVINSVSGIMDEEVITALKTTSGMWSPGTNNDEKVAMEKEVSVTFQLSYDLENNEAENNFKQIARILYSKGNKKFLIKGKPKAAIRRYTAALNYLPHDQSLLLMRGLCHYELGNIEKANEDWSRLRTLYGTDESINQLFGI